MEKITALEELSTNYAAQLRAQVATEKAVHAARRQGASWADVAAILGITRQAAQQKYSKSSPELIAADKLDDAPAVARYDARMETPNQDTEPETPSIFVDPLAPAPLPEYKNEYKWAKDDWKQDDPIHFIMPLPERRFGPCQHCGKKSHREKGGTWIYPGCLPTLNDPVYTLPGA